VLNGLSTLAETFPWIKGDIAPLRGLVRHKMEELSRTVALSRAGRQQEAVDLVLTDEGKALMADIRGTVQRIVDRAEAERTSQAAAHGDRRHVGGSRP